ncbi:hypothetical protein ACEWY4_007898 [Coilia grayii]|uniref:THAP-type domain-containing protein n=1 Tax=Coilia grayii TaxID=363190 RepID=A0ABD1K9E5_9TELE
MPDWCAAFCCSNERTVENRRRGITFHRFPKDKELRKKWEVALKRESFTARDRSVICSQHFLQCDFDRTRQTVRLRPGANPSVFNFPSVFSSPPKSRATSASRRAEESLSVASDNSPEIATSHPQPQPNDWCQSDVCEVKHYSNHVHPSFYWDHCYAMPASPTAVKTRLMEALARVESLERERKNAINREKRAKMSLKSVLGDLREKISLMKSSVRSFHSTQVRHNEHFENHVHVIAGLFITLFIKLIG